MLEKIKEERGRTEKYEKLKHEVSGLNKEEKAYIGGIHKYVNRQAKTKANKQRGRISGNVDRMLLGY